MRDPDADAIASPAFLPVGADVVVRLKDVIAILDQEACAAAATREFLGLARRRGQTFDLTVGAAMKTAVITTDRVLLSPCSSATLRRRLSAGGAF